MFLARRGIWHCLRSLEGRCSTMPTWNGKRNRRSALPEEKRGGREGGKGPLPARPTACHLASAQAGGVSVIMGKIF